MISGAFSHLKLPCNPVGQTAQNSLTIVMQIW